MVKHTSDGTVDYRRGAKIRPHWLTNIVDSPILKGINVSYGTILGLNGGDILIRWDSPILKGISYETSKKKEFNIFPKHTNL